MSATDLLLLIPLTLVGAGINSALAFGQSLVLAPALFAVFSPPVAVMIALVLAIEVNVLTLVAERRVLEVERRIVVVTSLAAVPGAILGVVLLFVASKSLLQLCVGLAVLASVASQAVPERRKGWMRSIGGAGVLSGTLNMTTGLSGPPVVLALQARGLSGGALRDSVAGALTGVNLVALIVLLLRTGESRLSTALGPIAVLAPLIVIGHRLGRLAFIRLTAEEHRRMTLAAIALAGAASSIAGLVAIV